MKKQKKRTLAAGLALSLLLGQGALASDAMGHDLHTFTTTLSEGTSLTTGYFWSDSKQDLRTERYLTYTPNTDVTPAVSYGDTVLSRATLSQMAKTLESAGKRVVGGTNGDFYVVSTGQPLGLVVTDGYLRSSASYHYAIGFKEDGTAFVGTPNLYISATMLGERVTIFGGVNKIRQVRTAEGGGLTLLTGDFGATTQNTSPGVDVFLRPVLEDLGETVSAEETGLDMDLVLSDLPKIGGRVKCVVDYVSEAAGENPIPEGCFVLTMNGQDDEGTLNMLRALQPGDEVNIDITSPDPQWAEATEALGAMYRLLENGALGSDLNAQQTARTAIGIKADGTVIFYTMDGLQSKNSIGATCTQVALRLQELGCVEAVGLDGGGSTTLGVSYPDQSAMGVINSPSDGKERANSTAIFLTTTLSATGEPSYLQIEPNGALLLAGAYLPLMAYQVDTGYRLMGAAPDATYQVTGGGTVADGVFTAGTESGVSTLTATQGDLTGTATVTVVRTPDTITVTNEKTGGKVYSLALEPGEQVSLTASSVWRNLSLQSRDENYTWACDEALGTITADGTFTASPHTVSGNITVTAGDKTVTIPVNVQGHILSLEDFEGETSPFTGALPSTAEVETSLAYVRYGRQSLALTYDLTEEDRADFTGSLAISAGEKYLGLWVYGDDSGNDLTALIKTGTGQEELPLVTLDFTGWQRVLTALPSDTTALVGLRVTAGEGETLTGTLRLDQFTTSNEELTDLTPPTLHLTVEGETLTATVSDNVDRDFPASAIQLTYDGQVLEGKWNKTTSTFTAKLPQEELTEETSDATRETSEEVQEDAQEQTQFTRQSAHRITLTAMDVSGNLGRATYEIEGDQADLFADLVDHWAAPYANYLYDQGVTNGVAEGETLYYQPGENITRAQFFTMVARWMGLDLTQYENVELPFADAGDIPSWAIPALKAMYQEGIVQGSLDGGELYAYPNAGVSRAEVMTILGRTQGKGWPEAELEDFTDGADVPAWAASYVKSLVGQGIINGYEDGSLRPTAPMTRAEAAKVLYALR